MKHLQNFLAPLLILGLMLSSMSSSTADQKEVSIVPYFVNSGTLVEVILQVVSLFALYLVSYVLVPYELVTYVFCSVHTFIISFS